MQNKLIKSTNLVKKKLKYFSINKIKLKIGKNSEREYRETRERLLIEGETSHLVPVLAIDDYFHQWEIEVNDYFASISPKKY